MSEGMKKTGIKAGSYGIIGFNWKYRYASERLPNGEWKTNDKIVGRTLMETHPGIEETGLFSMLKRCLEHRTPGRFDETFNEDCAENRIVHIIHPLPDGLLIVSEDWTVVQEGIYAETIEKLFNENMWNTTFNSVSDPIMILNVNNTIIHCNAKTYEILNMKPENVIGKKCWELFHPNEGQLKECAVLRLLRTKSRETSEMRFGSRYYTVTVDPILDENGEITGIVHIAHDITERQNRMLEAARNTEMLVRTEKMASVGKLVAGIAHEINNPLTAVLAYSTELSKRLKETKTDRINYFEQFPAYLDTIKLAAERCSEITKSLLAYARLSTAVKSDIDLNKIVESSLVLLTPELRVHRVRLVKRLDAKKSIIHGNPTEIQQILINLVVNAIDATPEGGVITITTRNESNENVSLIVEDTGCGISEEMLPKIFEPFFTTKPPGKSTGLGLSVVEGIVKSHNGNISVKSTVGKGTTFTVEFPLSGSPACCSKCGGPFGGETR